MNEKLISEAAELYYSDLFAYLFASLHNRHDAEDLCQTVFVKLACSEGIEPGTNLRAFLFKIAVNCIRDRSRRKTELPLETVNDRPDGAPLPSEIAEQNETGIKVRSILCAMPEQYSQVLALRFIAGLKPRQIAKCLDLGIKTVNNRLFNAKKLFEKEWENEKQSD